MQANVVVETPEEYHDWLKKAATHSPTVAPNQAATEYAQNHNQNVQTGWETVKPAAPPVVNFAG
jgi:cytochrome c oxidase subunit 2